MEKQSHTANSWCFADPIRKMNPDILDLRQKGEVKIGLSNSI